MLCLRRAMRTFFNYSQGYTIALVATILWSFTGLLISYLVTEYSLPALVLTFWRDFFLSSALALGLLFVSRKRFLLQKKHWLFLVFYGFTLSVFNSIWTFSVQYNGAAVATVMAFSSPAFTAIFSRIMYGESFSTAKVLSIFLSLTGIVLISGAFDPHLWSLNPRGIVFGLISGIAFAIYGLQGKHASEQKIDSWTALFYSFFIASLFLVLFNWANDIFLTGAKPLSQIFWLKNSISGWLLLFLLGSFPTLGGFGLYNLSLHYLSPITSNLIASLEPVFTAFWAYVFLGELLPPIQVFGGLLVFSSVILLRYTNNPWQMKKSQDQLSSG